MIRNDPSQGSLEVSGVPCNAGPGAQAPICLVTGSSRGLGRAVAEELATRGASVMITSRDADTAAGAAQELGPAGNIRALSIGLDVSPPASMTEAAHLIKDQFGRLDVLVNNAAAYLDWNETATNADLTGSRTVMETNLYGAWNMIQPFLPLLRTSEHPRNVNVASSTV